MTDDLDDGWIAEFVKTAPPIDSVRDEAARCAEETAKAERGVRSPLRTALNGPAMLAEFSDAAMGTAAEVATAVGRAMIAKRVPFHAWTPWEIAARLLRSGWNRGDRLLGHVVKAAKERS